MHHATTILIVDDEPTGQETLAALLHAQGYQLVFAASGTDALAQAATHQPDLILLDVMMPGMDGYDVCRQLRATPTLAEVPIVMVTALDDRASRLTGIAAGADDFIAKPYDRAELRARVSTITRLNRYRRLLHARSAFERVIQLAPHGILMLDTNETILLVNPALTRMLGMPAGDSMIGQALRAYVAPHEYAHIAREVRRVYADPACAVRFESALPHKGRDLLPVEVEAGYIEWDGHPAVQVAIRDISELAQAYTSTLEGWARALELRDTETEGHSQRVTALTLQLARALGLHEAELAHIHRGALLHDIGKMGIPDRILLKPGPLTAAEWAVMRQHPIYAYQLLAPIAYLRPALDIPYCHHERWDGSGYPRGLVGEQIPLAARILAIVDVWDALSHDRPYRTAWPEARVRTHIRSLAGAHFDPHIAEVFLTSVLTEPAQPPYVMRVVDDDVDTA